MEDGRPFEGGDMRYGGCTNCTQQQIRNNETVFCNPGIIDRDTSSANFYLMLVFLLLLTVVPAVSSLVCLYVTKDRHDVSSFASDGDTVVLEKEYEGDDIEATTGSTRRGSSTDGDTTSGDMDIDIEIDMGR